LRKTREELSQLCKQLNINTLWSWSRVHSYMNSKYEYFLKYVRHIEEDNNNCAYAPLGGLAHELLEKFYGQEIRYENMPEEFDTGWMLNIDIVDLKFNRNDKAKNDSIKNKYKENLDHFFRHHKVLENDEKSKFELEKFILIKMREDIYLQGYIDVLRILEDGSYIVGDWKTSTIYKGKKALDECGQLVTYAIGIHQLTGIPYDKIKIGWNFLKYQNVTIEQKNGKKKVREIERCKLGSSLTSNVKTWLKHFGYDEKEIDDYIVKLVDSNSIECLPKEVQEKFEFNDCWVYVELNEELINFWKDTIISNVDEINSKTKEYELTKNNKLFWDSEESVKSQSYYYANLSGYSANLLLPYKQYLEKLESEKNGIDLLASNKKQDINTIEEDMDLMNSLLEGILNG